MGGCSFSWAFTCQQPTLALLSWAWSREPGLQARIRAQQTGRSPPDHLAGGWEWGLEERSSSRLSSCCELPDLRLEPGSPLDAWHCFQSSLIRPKCMGHCGCPAVPGGLEERVSRGLETALTPPVARTPKPRLLLCLWGSPLLFHLLP